jgi:hypothetical protein
MVKNNINLNYNSTLEDSLLTFQCDDGLFPKDLFAARCYRNGSWIPNPSGHMCATSSAGRSDHNLYPYTINELLPCLLSANCGDPSPPDPSDGYIEPYTSTVEGTVVNRVHVCENGQQSQAEQIICSPHGQWERINGSTCPVMPNSNFISAELKNYDVILLISCRCKLCDYFPEFLIWCAGGVDSDDYYYIIYHQKERSAFNLAYL